MGIPYETTPERIKELVEQFVSDTQRSLQLYPPKRSEKPEVWLPDPFTGISSVFYPP